MIRLTEFEQCCHEDGIEPPQDEECKILWEDEIEQCRSYCSIMTSNCVSSCYGNKICEDNCMDRNARCVGQCPCHEECPQGCPCISKPGENYPDFCPTVKPPPGSCRDQWKDEIEKCYDHCYNKNYQCIRDCPKDNEACYERCHIQAIQCPEDCPCHENCPNGCPCGWEDVDCSEFRPFNEMQSALGIEPRMDWCSDVLPPGTPQPDPHCEILWGEELKDCMNYCEVLENSCISRCGGEDACEAKCHRERICCERDCPCHPNCLDGCPCPAWIDHGFCPEMIVDQDCMKDWWQEAKRCENSCRDDAYRCLDRCSQGDVYCVRNCHDNELACLDNCPCHKNCQNGCDHGWCPEWDKWCPYTTPVSTTPRTTTPRSTTTSRTTTSTKAPPAPTAPDVDEIHGDSILILSDDKAMLHQWDLNGSPVFHHLQDSFNDRNSVWHQNGYYVHDACSVQFKGESYLIGGAFYCDNGDAQNCAHINVQRSVVKVSKTKCGLDIVWDGFSQKLPFDMKEHSCAVFQRRIDTSNDYSQSVMMCSPDDTANDPHNDKVYTDKFCWRYLYKHIIMP